MKKHLLLMTIGALAFATSCAPTAEKETANEETTETEEVAEESNEEEVTYPYAAGAEFNASSAITPTELLTQLEGFDGDSLEVTLATSINECCKKKGCWMSLDMGEGNEEMFVRFKDYEFFVPLNAAGHETTVQGVVYRDTITVAQLQHYAEDAGASADSIASITEPEVKLAFQANGVMVQ